MSRITLLPVLAVLGACAPSYDLDRAAVVDLRSDAPHVCVPPTDGAASLLHAVQMEDVTLEGTLVEMPEDSTEGSPVRIEREGVAVTLWRLAEDTYEAETVLTSAETDLNGDFGLDWTPTREPIGFQVEDGYIQTLTTTVIEPSRWGANIVCAYWADADGMLISFAPQGDEVQLIVQAVGELGPLSLVVREVGNDLGGDDVIAHLDGAAFVDGHSHTTWAVDGDGGGLFEGKGLELQFSAISQPVDAMDGEAVNGSSNWLGTNL